MNAESVQAGRALCRINHEIMKATPPPLAPPSSTLEHYRLRVRRSVHERGMQPCQNQARAMITAQTFQHDSVRADAR